jgi:hypothetical protein
MKETAMTVKDAVREIIDELRKQVLAAKKKEK